jgi:hypothetical protein
MEPNIIDKMVKVVKVYYMDHSVSSTNQFCIKVELQFLHPIMYINNWSTYHIPIFDTIGILTETVYNALFALHKYCGISREELLLWVVSKIDFDRAWDKNMYCRLRTNLVFDK